jgi:hypothetical protein
VGAVHVKDTDAFPNVPVKPVGALGTVAGIKAEEFAVYVPVPARFTDATLNT